MKSSRLVVLVFFIALALSGCSDSTSSQEQPRDECETVSFGYLNSLKEGSADGMLFWKPGIRPKTLFAVHEFGQIKQGSWLHPNRQPYKIPRRYYEYEVQSSTQGGFPIRKRWDVITEQSGDKAKDGIGCFIVDLTEAE